MATLGGCVRSSESPPELLDLLLKRFNAALVDRRNRFVFGALDPPSMKPSQHPFNPPAKARRTSTLAGPGRIPKVCLFDAAARACCRTTATGSNGLRRAQGRDHFTFPPLARACDRIEPTSPPPQRWSWLPLKRRPYSRRLRKAERCLKQVERVDDARINGWISQRISKTPPQCHHDAKTTVRILHPIFCVEWLAASYGARDRLR